MSKKNDINGSMVSVTVQSSPISQTRHSYFSFPLSRAQQFAYNLHPEIEPVCDCGPWCEGVQKGRLWL